MKKFKVCSTQGSHTLNEDPIEAETLEEALTEILEGQGIKLVEIEEKVDNKKHPFFGYLMTEKQSEELSEALTEDILQRYDNGEYHDPDIIDAFVQDNHLEKEKR